MEASGFWKNNLSKRSQMKMDKRELLRAQSPTLIYFSAIMVMAYLEDILCPIEANAPPMKIAISDFPVSFRK